MVKKLQKIDNVNSNRNRLNSAIGMEKKRTGNILTEKLPHMEDFPTEQKVSLFERGAMLGEEDLTKSDQIHSTTVTCHSKTGKLLKLSYSMLLNLRKKAVIRNELSSQIAFKSFRQNCDDIN